MGSLRHRLDSSLVLDCGRQLGNVYVETIEASALAVVNSRTSAVLGDWKMPGEGLSLKGRILEGLNGIRRSRSEGLLQIFDLLAPQVGLEPTTLRLTAVRFALAPAATCCYKFLCFVWFSRRLPSPICYPYNPDYALF